MKNVLFILAHYDDESFSIGTILRMRNAGYKVHVKIVCGNGYHLDDTRIAAFANKMHQLNIGYSIMGYFDLTLNDLNHTTVVINMKEHLSQFIEEGDYDTIFTNHGGDHHKDHQFVSDIVRTVCRPGTSKAVKALYECYVPGSTELGEGTNKFNTIIDIGVYEASILDYQSMYKNDLKGSTSIESAEAARYYFGKMYGFGSVEIFKCIFDKTMI